MSNRLLRFLMYGLLCLSLVGVAACGDDDEPQEGNNGPDECSTAADCAPGQLCVNRQCAGDPYECTVETEADDCGSGEICVSNECQTGCRANEDCSGDLVCLDDNSCGCTDNEQCGEGNLCVDGACEAAPPAQCAGVQRGGQVECDPNEEVADGYECANVGFGTMCYLSCTPGETGDNVCREDQRSDCAAGSFCVNQLGLPNFCFPSQCDNPEDLESCDALEQQNPDSYPDGASCLPAQGGTFVCQSAGPKAEGEACDGGDCGEGLICGLDSVCTPLCDEDSDCSGDDRCLGEDGRFFEGFNWGICGQGCDAFSEGQCGEGQSCQTISSDDGICTDIAEEPAPMYGSCDGYTLCNDDSDCAGEATCGSGGTCQYDRPSQCVEGSQCVTLTEGDIGEASEGRCLPLCDTSDDVTDQDQLNLRCPGGDASAFGRFIHLAQGEGDLDIYINDTLVVDNRSEAAGAATPIARDFLELPIGTVNIDVVAGDAADNASPLASLELFTQINNQNTFVLVNGTSGLEIREVNVPRDVEAPAAGQGKLRVAHNASANTAATVDVYLVDDGTVVLPTDTPFAADLAYGEVTPFSSDLAAGDYDVVVYEAGAIPATATPLATLDATVAADSIATLHVWGNTALSATAVEYTQAAVTMTAGFCYDSGGDVGICFQQCTGSDGYGQGQCSNEVDVCSPFQGSDVCWASQGIPLGEACPIDERAPCESGAFCRPYGDGTGVCASYCQPFGGDNSALGCPAEQACQAVSDEERNLGQCGFECQPTDFPSDPADPSCPANLQNCLPYADGTSGFCSASGDVALGADCGDVTVENCAPGGVCRRPATMLQCSVIPQEGTLVSTLYGPLGALGNVEGGTCRQVCEPFTNGCPDGQGCMPNALEASAKVGYCMPAAEELSELEALDVCPYELNGMMCGDGSVCTTLQGSSLCIQFCDRTDDSGSVCTGENTCQAFFSEQDSLGWCVPE